MTVDELQTRITNKEFIQWKAFLVYKNSMEEREMQRVKNG